MERKFVSLDGRPPSPLWVRTDRPKPADWQERALAYTCCEGPREQLIALERTSGRDHRTRYLTSALVALRKVGLTLERWLDGLDALGSRDTDGLWRRALADEQGARQRLTWELLVELIGFSGTDDPRFWAHHDVLLRLQDQAAQLADVQTFFSCRPVSRDLGLLAIAEEVAELEDQLGELISQCWYAHRRKPATPDKIAKAGVRALSSQRSRFQHVLPTATSTERVALGVSYRRLYSRLSRNVHFSMPHAHEQEMSDSARGHGDGEISIDQLRWGVVVVGRLGNLCLARLQALTGLPGGPVCRLHQEARDGLSADPRADMLFTIAAGNVRVGDFALVHDRLTEVSAREVNTLGHARYRVTFVAERPHPDIGDEWHPATDVFTVWEREKVEGWMKQALAEAAPETRDRFLMIEPQQRLREIARAVWEDGGRRQVLDKLRNAEPIDYS